MCQGKEEEGCPCKGLEKGAMLYDNDSEWDDDAPDTMLLDDETPRTIEFLDHEKEEDLRLHAESYMGLDVEKCENDVEESSPAARPGANSVLRSATKKAVIGPKTKQDTLLCLKGA